MTRVLITGASGFVGQHLAAYLTAKGFQVRGMGRSPQIPHITDYHQCDIRNYDQVLEAMQGCDGVVHLACSQLPPSWQDPNKDFQINAMGTQHVLEAARVSGITKVVYASTGQIYGRQATLPNTEDSQPNPASPYAGSKLCGEVLCHSYAQSFGMNTTILRLFNVYGVPYDEKPRQAVEAIFMRKAQANEPLIIKSHPEEARDFIHIHDVLHAFHLALTTDHPNQIFNIGTGQKTTLAQLAQLAIDSTHSSSELIQAPSEAPPTQFQADAHKAKKQLGFVAKIPLDQGLKSLL